MTGYLKILNQYFTEYMHAVHVEYVKDLIIQNMYYHSYCKQCFKNVFRKKYFIFQCLEQPTTLHEKFL